MNEKSVYTSPQINVLNRTDVIATSGDDNILEWDPVAITLPEEGCYQLD